MEYEENLLQKLKAQPKSNRPADKQPWGKVDFEKALELKKKKLEDSDKEYIPKLEELKSKTKKVDNFTNISADK